MSATGRGFKREPNDNYPTPDWLIAAIVRELRRYNRHRILEPACGDGRIVDALRLAFPRAEVISGDIRTGQDFQSYQYPGQFDVIITNPPYSLAMAFIQRALEYRKPLGAVVMLTRLSFLGSQDRCLWLRQHKPSVLVTPRRPKFTKEGSGDNCEYAWLVWDDYPYRLEFLETENRRH